LQVTIRADRAGAEKGKRKRTQKLSGQLLGEVVHEGASRATPSQNLVARGRSADCSSRISAELSRASRLKKIYLKESGLSEAERSRWQKRLPSVILDDSVPPEVYLQLR
jgi:hypothetical protein